MYFGTNGCDIWLGYSHVGRVVYEAVVPPGVVGISTLRTRLPVDPSHVES